MRAPTRLARLVTLALTCLVLQGLAAPVAGALLSVARPVSKGSGPLSPRLAALADGAAPIAAQAAAAPGLPASGLGSLLTDHTGAPLVYIHMVSVASASRAALAAAGARIVHVSPQYRVVTAAVAPRSLRRIAALPGVVWMAEALAPGRRATADARLAPAPARQTTPSCPGGAVVSEGDAALGAAAARARFSVDGAGVTVGVLADSFNVARGAPITAGVDIGTGDLPGPGNPCGRTASVRVVAEPRLGAGGDEGRAMLQIIHDLAPGADLAFATAADGLYAFAENIKRLRWEAGADVIVDDYYYPEEPLFQDGPVSVAIGDVVADGAVYATAGGNINVVDAQGRPIGSYETPAYRPMACPPLSDAGGRPLDPGPSCHDFDAGAGADPGLGITLPAGGGIILNFQWSEPWFGVRTDLDIFLADDAGLVLAQSTAGLGPAPFEFLTYTNTGATPQTVQLVVARYTGDAPRFKFTLASAALNLPPPTALEYAGASGPDIIGPTSGDHGISPHAISVGAAPFDDPLRPEVFSSLGPALVYWAPVADIRPAAPLPAPELRVKPDLAAVQGVRTTFYGRRDLGGPRCDPALPGAICRFYGTSAAAPHVAGVAALLVERARRADVDLGGPLAMRLLQTSARPMRGSAAAFGAGLVDAEAALVALEVALADPVLAGPPMPDLIGLSEQEAKARLVESGVTIDRIVVDYQDRVKLGPRYDSLDAFEVVSTLPSAEARLGARGTVILGVRAP